MVDLLGAWDLPHAGATRGSCHDLHRPGLWMYDVDKYIVWLEVDSEAALLLQG